MPEAVTIDDAVAALCPNCGLCCNGVLFGDVELQQSDSSSELAEHGMQFFRKGRKLCFSQPCACFDGRHCRAYFIRPERCRAFECRLLQRVAAGKISLPAAREKISETLQVLKTLRTLLREAGQTDEQLPLNLRYAAAIREPIDFADKKGNARRKKLMSAVDRLTKILERDFLG